MRYDMFMATVPLTLSGLAAFFFAVWLLRRIAAAHGAESLALQRSLAALNLSKVSRYSGHLLTGSTITAAVAAPLLCPPSTFQSTAIGGVEWLLLSAGVVALGAILGFFVPMLVCAGLHAHRRVRLESQLVDGLNAMANALRAGRSLEQSFELVRDNLAAPISEEFDQMLREMRCTGRSANEVLTAFAERSKLKDLDLVAVAVTTLLAKGGSLASSFGSIVETIRQRMKVQTKIRALTMSGIAQGTVALLAPFGFLLFLRSMAPEQAAILFHTPAGWAILAAAMTLNLVGAVLMHRIVRVEI